MTTPTENITNTTSKLLVSASKACWDFTAKQTTNLVYSACKSVTNKIEAKKALAEHESTVAVNNEEQRIRELLKDKQE